MIVHRDAILRDSFRSKNTSVALIGKFKIIKDIKFKEYNYIVMVLKLCDSSSRYKFVAFYLLYTVCLQICRDFRDPVHTVALLIVYKLVFNIIYRK
jgi:hypothetical protein